MTKREEFLAITSYDEYEKRKGEFEEVTPDVDVLMHCHELWMQKYGETLKNGRELPPDEELFEYKKASKT